MKPLNSKQPNGATPPTAALPAILQQLSERAGASLCDAFGQLLASCDDEFFALAEQATSNHEQSIFFESLRAVRLEKDGVVARFQSELDARFQDLTGTPKVEVAGLEARSKEELSLLQNTELEKSVALNSMIARARSEANEILYYLNKRLDFLVEHVPVDETNNPLDPAQLCGAFAASTEVIDLDIKARVVLFKQFERMLVGELPSICATANQQLIDAGVLPSIARTAKSSPTSASIVATEPAVNFSQINQLLNTLRDQSGNAEAQQIPMLFSSSGGEPIADKELLTLVSDLQSHVGDSPAAIADIRQLLKNMLDQRKVQGKSGRLTNPDEDIINLTAMFFDFVLEDRQLPTHVQALIGRLQFPVLKIALQDKAFFNKNVHPARRLINELVGIGMSMSDSEASAASAVYERLTTILRSINDEQQPSEASFARALTQVQQIRGVEHSKAEKIEKRTCDSAQSEATTKQAQAAVRNLLVERLQEVSIPPLIHEFLVDDWQQVLFLARLKYGDRSVEEIEVEQTMNDLIWSSLHHVDAKSQQRLKRLLPELQQRLRKWLTLTALTEERVEQSLQPLLALHSQLVEPQESASVERRKLAEDQAEALQPPAEQQKSWGEMTALERQYVEYKDLAYSYIKQADDYPNGTWFSINNKADDTLLRCKLALKVTANDSYVFVNRLGFQVLTMKRKDFAYALQQGRANALQTGQFFERTLGRIVDQLQQLAGTITQTAQNPQA